MSIKININKRKNKKKNNNKIVENKITKDEKLDDNYDPFYENITAKNIKYLIFLTDKHLNKKKKFSSKSYKFKLLDKGIIPINYYKWEIFFDKLRLPSPSFDLFENSPSHGIVYKRFTLNKYLSLDNYDNFLFQEQYRSLSTLVSYMGAHKISIKNEYLEDESNNVDISGNIMNEAKLKVKVNKSRLNEKNLFGEKIFDKLVSPKIFYNCEKFDACAYSGSLFGVDAQIYRRLKFVNIVSERFNGQQKSFFTIYKNVNNTDIIEIGSYINKLNIGLNVNINKIKKKKELYTVIIDYYNLEELRKESLVKLQDKKFKKKLKNIEKK